ncbi:Type I restriction-modification system, restriction subunit R [Rubrivivax sp. A210]|uniref:DEAD/DEAH box helicase family protein n=1 Tax=Rubrivivax sp. A210 TaxID=2772301 RepID=UPI00191A26C9|nr:DEAD/DEAH box helicase family protein [Rubrivivax sp. A210]CAD5371789.1 Type I restriction-modification system, restriction subunit R [Rubrivivax sp. A210]
MSNFSFLLAEWPLLHEAATKAEDMAHTDARASCFYARRTLEMAVAWLYKHDRGLRLPYQDNLSALIHEPTFAQVVGQAVFTKAKVIKELGNQAVHSGRKVLPADAVVATRELFHIGYWLARTYGQRGRPDPGLAFNPALLARPAVAAPAVPPQTLDQLQKLQAQLAERDERLSTLLGATAALDAELARLREQVAAAKLANAATPDTHDYSEAETRDYFIDLLLKEAGWQLDPKKNFEIEVSGMPNAQGKGFVDYVLWGDDGKPLALVEAKRTKKGAKVGQQQARLYADCLEAQYGQRPVIFCSNGYEHWIWDDALYPPRAVQGFYKKAELALMIQRRSSRKPLATAVIDDSIIERYYQVRTVRRIGETFEQHHLRKALAVMATGAGKTRTVIALADVLMRANWAKRVLFLADRVALVNQAVNAFKRHLPDSSPVNLVTDKHTEGRVFVSTYPTMMGLIDEAMDGQRRFGVGHFDLIVIDEAHRSVYQKYRAIFEYFDCLLVGLTATPKDEIDHNTYGLFDLEDGVPTDAYPLDQAVADGHLVPPLAVSVPLKFQRDGIKYAQLSEAEKEQWDALEWTEDGTPPPNEVEAAALNKWLFNTDTVDKALAHLMTKGQKVAGGDRLGKTIVFAKNNEHAEFIAERFNVNYPHYKGEFARVVTYKTVYAQSLIDAFSAKDRAPHIAISVDMLDTGIDVPEVVNLVFFKIVRSRTKFWQMVGRGTRLCPDLFGPGEHKKFFYLFDYCQNLEFFSQNPDTTDGSGGESLGTRLFKARLSLIEELDHKGFGGQHVNEPPAKYGPQPNHQQLRDSMAGHLHQVVAAMNVQNFVVRPQRRAVEKFARPDAWKALTGDDHTELASHIASLPTELVDADEEAKRFDLLVLRTQLAIVKAAPGFGALRDQIRTIASALEEQEAVPAIQAEMVLIQAIAGDEWWNDVTLGMLENARKRLRLLVKLIEKSKKKVVYTDFIDELGAETHFDLPEVGIAAGLALDMIRFKDKARQFLKAHEGHLALQRLRRGQALTPTDLAELERMLADAGGTPELIQKAAEGMFGLGIFIRSLVGMEREAVSQAFSEVIAGTQATPDQIEFIELIVSELTTNGVMEAGRLYESPFLDISPQGPEGLFPVAKVDRMVQVLDEIRQRAAA